MTILYLLRHGETVWNVEQRMQGRADSPLTERGRAQAARHAEVLERLGGVGRLLVSPSGRTRATAAIVGARLGVPQSFHPELMERDSGAWEGLDLDEIRTRHAQAWQDREADPYFHRPPGGENHADLEVRVGALLDALREELGRPGAEPVGVVTHGVMSRVILKCLLDLSPAEAMRVRHPNALFYRIEFPDPASRHGYFLDGAGPVAGLLRH